jgi:hypothetical protein
MGPTISLLDRISISAVFVLFATFACLASWRSAAFVAARRAVIEDRPVAAEGLWVIRLFPFLGIVSGLTVAAIARGPVRWTMSISMITMAVAWFIGVSLNQSRTTEKPRIPFFCARLGGLALAVLPVVVLGFRLGALMPTCLGALALANPQALVRLQLEFMSEEKEVDSLRPAGVVAVSLALVVLFELWRR